MSDNCNVPQSDPERLADMVNHMSDAFLALDRQWRFTYFNDRALRSLGADRGAAIGRNAFELFPQFAGTEWERQCRRAMEEREPVSFELEYPPNETWTEVRVYPTTEGIALFYTDVTARKRDEQAFRRQLQVTDGINAILRASLEAKDDEALGAECLRVAEQVTDSAFGFIAELRDDGDLHDIAISNPGWTACTEISPHRGGRRLGAIAGLHGEVIRSGRALFTNDPMSDPRRVGLPDKHPPLESFLGMPLKEGDHTFGLIGVGNRDGGYDEEVVERLETLAPAVVQAFQRLRAERRQVRHAEFDRALSEVREVAHSSLEDRRILERAVVDVARVSGLNAVAVHVRSEDGWRFSHSHGLPEALSAARLTDEQAPMSMKVLSDGEPLIMRDARNDPRANEPLVTQFDIRSIVGFPLAVRGHSFGVLFAGNIGTDVQIGDAEIGFLKRVAETLSLALENARLYESQLRIAETLQQALLALPDSIEGVWFAHAYRSAAEAARVGGDFYDIFELEHHRIAVVIGDVAGKGLGAAALTSLLKNTIRAHASSAMLAPARVLRLTSELVYKVTPSDVFATVFLAYVDRDTGEMVYSNAGHTTTAIVDAHGETRRLEGNSPLIGAFTGVDFLEAHERICEDELLLLYTDGIIEARADSELYGEDRLFDTVSHSKNGDPAKVVRAVVTDVLGFAHGRLNDDAAIMAVKLLTGTASTRQQQVPV